MEEEKKKPSATRILKEIKRQTRRKFTAEEKIKIVLENMRGEETIAAICRKYDIHQNNYFKWSKEFIEAGKRRLSGDALREATRDEIADLRRMNDLLKRELGEHWYHESLNNVTPADVYLGRDQEALNEEEISSKEHS